MPVLCYHNDRFFPNRSDPDRCATFDLTALGLLEGWLVSVTIVDMAWGTILIPGTAGGAYRMSRTLLTTEGLSGG